MGKIWTFWNGLELLCDNDPVWGAGWRRAPALPDAPPTGSVSANMRYDISYSDWTTISPYWGSPTSGDTFRGIVKDDTGSVLYSESTTCSGGSSCTLAYAGLGFDSDATAYLQVLDGDGVAVYEETDGASQWESCG